MSDSSIPPQISSTTQTVPQPVSVPPAGLNQPLKCIVCGYEGPEKVCIKCGMLMEEKCPVCYRTLSDCICHMNDDVKEK